MWAGETAHPLPVMFNVPVPRRSFLDSPLRTRSHENRRLSGTTPMGESHLGHGHRSAPMRPALPGQASPATPARPHARA